MNNIKKIIQEFNFGGNFVDVKEFGSGHINGTFLAEFENERYVIQKINTAVFKNPDELMENIFSVTSFLKNKAKQNGLDENRSVLNFIKTKNGGHYYRDENGDCFRAYVFVENSVCYDKASSAELFGKSGKAFGSFQKQLNDFDASSLYETIPNFHNTSYRFENEFLPAVINADKAKLDECKAEIEYIKSQKGNMNRLTSLAEQGKIPLRVTHNDTKLNNVLFDKATNEVLCVIDLDTVMPGLALYDFGDSIRFGASIAAEDENDLSNVCLNLEYFKAYAKEYLFEAGSSLTSTEKDNLAFSAYLLTLELAMRFLTDYLNSNIYFKIDYEKHNLVRAKNQITLAKDIYSKLDEMNNIIKALTV